MLETGVKHWYAVQTKSHFERALAAELLLKGISSFCPEVAELHQWADRQKTIMQPVFRGYVFAQFPDHAEGKVSVLSCSGAVRILGTQNLIEAIPEKEIEAIRIAVQANACVRCADFEEGAWVRVRRGPLKNVEGRLVRIKNETRLVLTISLLRQSVAAEIDLQDVEILKPSTLTVKSQPVGRLS